MSSEQVVNQTKVADILNKRKVLEPCNIEELCIDLQKMKDLLEEYLTPIRKEYYKSIPTQNKNLEPGFMEFIVAKCINGNHVGAGHFPVDVIKDDKGIDVLCVCLNGIQTNEKSIMQNFSECGNNLDDLFKNSHFQEALGLFINAYRKKLENAKNEKKIKNLYYLAFISNAENVYMSAFKLNVEYLSNIKYTAITKQKKSIKFNGFIDDKFGSTTLCKSKKRLELRLKKDILDCYNTIKII